MFKPITFEVIGDQLLVCEGCEERVEHVLKGVQAWGRFARGLATNVSRCCLTRACWTPRRLRNG
jgi:hypothetical protein